MKRKGNLYKDICSIDNLYNEVLKEIIGIDVTSKAELLKLFQDYSEAKEE